MTGFSIQAPGDSLIRFRFYTDQAPLTAEAFGKILPFSVTFFHARLSGQEIWTDSGPRLDIRQENSTVLAGPGEVAIGPINPQRNKVAGLMGIFYGDGKLLDGSNIFAKVFEEDLPLLQKLGDKVWKEGARELKFEKIA
jgi:Protein of unknown function (DUF3830)